MAVPTIGIMDGIMAAIMVVETTAVEIVEGMITWATAAAMVMADVREMKENQPVKMFVKQYAKLLVKTLEKR